MPHDFLIALRPGLQPGEGDLTPQQLLQEQPQVTQLQEQSQSQPQPQQEQSGCTKRQEGKCQCNDDHEECDRIDRELSDRLTEQGAPAS